MSSCLASSRLKIWTSATPRPVRWLTMVGPNEPVPPVMATVAPSIEFPRAHEARSGMSWRSGSQLIRSCSPPARPRRSVGSNHGLGGRSSAELGPPAVDRRVRIAPRMPSTSSGWTTNPAPDSAHDLGYVTFGGDQDGPAGRQCRLGLARHGDVG